MSQTQRKKPIKEKTEPKFREMTPAQIAEARQTMLDERLSLAKTRHSPFGPVRYFEYSYGGHSFEQQEINQGQAEQITALLIASGMEGISSFNDATERSVMEFSTAITKALNTAAFLETILTKNGEPVADGFFSLMPDSMFEDLFNEAMADFFFLNPKSMQRFMLLPSRARVAVETE